MLAISVILGLWLILSPFIFGFIGAALWTNILLGVLIGGLAYFSSLGKGRFYAIVAVGLFFILGAFFAGGGALLWNGLIVGVILAIGGYLAANQPEAQNPHAQ
ncbi:MAG: SPW repeat protein [Meiothermus sp.]|nr:SPW repeat protein [Meiothermus sp.]